MRPNRSIHLLLLGMALAFAGPVAAAESEPELELAPEPLAEHAPALDRTVCAPNGIAVGGYDLVSYFSADGAQIGEAAFEAPYLNLHYRFANDANRVAFLANPEQYLPSYRGWCSTNLSMGRLACPDYTNYKVENGKLLFFERVGFSNGQDVWNSQPLLHKRQADKNFGLLSSKR